MKLEKTFDVNYYRYLHSAEPLRTQTREWSHKYTETWAATDLYCPLCGKKEIWTAQGSGDYYVGSQSLCLACGAEHYLDGSRPATEDSDQQRLEALR